MKVVSFIIRIYSLLFHLLFSLFLLALSIVGMSSGGATLSLGMAPWEGSELTGSLLALGLGGILFVILAFNGAQRLLYMIWTLVITYLLVNGYFLSNYRFGTPDEFSFAIYLSLGALLAFMGSILLLRAPLFNKKRS